MRRENRRKREKQGRRRDSGKKGFGRLWGTKMGAQIFWKKTNSIKIRRATTTRRINGKGGADPSTGHGQETAEDVEGNTVMKGDIIQEGVF